VIFTGRATASETSGVYRDEAIALKLERRNAVKGLLTRGAELHERPIEALRELDRRSGNGLDVKLVWEPATDCVFIGVIDQRTGNEFAIEVDPASALDAFYHPFAYESRATDDDAHDQLVGTTT
jgi:hypothetical protein